MQLTFESMFSVVTYILLSIGYWMIFKKFGKKPWLGLIPFARDYQLAVCADREEEGRLYVLFTGLLRVLMSASSFMESGSGLQALITMIALIVLIPSIVYSIRILKPLCVIFDRSPRWIFLWFFFEWFAAFLWGISKKFNPLPQEKRDERAAELSGVTTKGDGKNLSINIEERSAVSHFKKHILLKDIHLNVEPGHMVLLLGGSGAGKTTFLNAVTGYEKAKADIELGEGNVYKDYKKIKYDIGFVPQGDLMRGTDTVYRTLQDAATLRLPADIGSKQLKEKIDSVLDFFGIGMLKDTLVDKLSGGQRKRLSIAMEYISNPKLFILDEPDSGLDGIVTRKLFKQLREIADTGKIVIVITHTPDRVIDLFDDVIVLAKDAERTGRLAFYGSVDEAYEFFGKTSMEGILLSVNQIEEGGEGRADEMVGKYTELTRTKLGGAA